MAMLIAWHVTNKATYPQDKRFSKNVFVVAPGLTVRSRLSVLIPDSEGNYYDLFNIVPQERRAGCAGHIGDPASHRPAQPALRCLHWATPNHVPTTSPRARFRERHRRRGPSPSVRHQTGAWLD